MVPIILTSFAYVISWRVFLGKKGKSFSLFSFTIWRNITRILPSADFGPNTVADFLFSHICVVSENTPAIVPKKVNIPSTDDNNFVLKIAFIYKICRFCINDHYVLIPY